MFPPDGGIIQKMRRRSGKTTKLVEIANTLVEHQPVAFITGSLAWGGRVRKQYGLSEKVILGTTGSWGVKTARGTWKDRLRGHQVAYLIFDEVKPGAVREICRHFPDSLLVAAYYT